MPGISTQVGRSPGTFRGGALALLVPAGAVWVIAASGAYSDPLPGVSPQALGAHWAAAWAAPLAVAAVLAYGTAQTGADVRVAAAGPSDLRTRWWSEQSPVLVGAALVTFFATVGLANFTGEPLLALLLVGLVGDLVAVAVTHFVVMRLGFAPGVSLGLVTTVVTALLLLPYQFGAAAPVALDATLHQWVHGVTTDQRPAGTTGLLLWCSVAVALVAVARFSPRDVAHLTWLTKKAR